MPVRIVVTLEMTENFYLTTHDVAQMSTIPLAAALKTGLSAISVDDKEGECKMRCTVERPDSIEGLIPDSQSRYEVPIPYNEP